MSTPFHITVAQVRAVQALAPQAWTLKQTPGGWIVHRGEATLVSINSRQPRVFKSLDRAVRRLAIEAGVRTFAVEATAST